MLKFAENSHIHARILPCRPSFTSVDS